VTADRSCAHSFANIAALSAHSAVHSHTSERQDGHCRPRAPLRRGVQLTAEAEEACGAIGRRAEPGPALSRTHDLVSSSTSRCNALVNVRRPEVLECACERACRRACVCARARSRACVRACVRPKYDALRCATRPAELVGVSSETSGIGTCFRGQQHERSLLVDVYTRVQERSQRCKPTHTHKFAWRRRRRAWRIATWFGPHAKHLTSRG
jgi:hypothetical protein